MNKRTWKVYQFLKENCVGEENKMKGKDIVENLILNDKDGIFNEYRIETFRADIVKIKNNSVIKRIISSNHYGYWLSTKEDENDGLYYQKIKIKKQIKNCILNGVSIEYFYNCLNEMKELSLGNKVSNGQKRIVINKEKDEIVKKSDDLIKK